MYVSDDGLTVISTPPRTGSRSVRDWLLERGGWRQTPTHHNLDAEALEKCERYAVLVKNHYATLVSWWLVLHEVRQRGLGFGEWVRELATGNSTLRRWVDEGRLWARWLEAGPQPTLLRSESLEADLGRFLGVECKLPRIGVSPGRDGHHYSAWYDDETVAVVTRFFGHEIAACGYSFERVEEVSRG